MAFSMLSELGIAENMAMPFLESLVRQGLGANEVLRRYGAARASILARVAENEPEMLASYQKHFGRIRRQKGLNLVRFLRAQKIKRPYTRSLTRAALPDDSRLPIGRLGMSHRYAYTFRARGRGPDGQRVERWVTVTTDHLQPWGELEGIAADYFEGTDQSGGLTEYRMTHQDILRRPESLVPPL